MKVTFHCYRWNGKEPYVDKDRLGCVGASFGGFSYIGWQDITTNGSKRSLLAMVSSTWKCNIWKLKKNGLPTGIWEAHTGKTESGGTAYVCQLSSPIRREMGYPILCIHGEKDYRILANQFSWLLLMLPWCVVFLQSCWFIRMKTTGYWSHRMECYGSAHSLNGWTNGEGRRKRRPNKNVISY